MFDLLKMNFLSSLSTSAKLVDHIHQASDLGTFSSLSFEKQKEADVTLLQKRVVFVVEAPHSSNVAPSYAQLDELEKKNLTLTGKLSAKSRMSEMKKSMFVLKSSLAQKDSELNSSTTTLDDHKGVLN